jgi:hypothetical protein
VSQLISGHTQTTRSFAAITKEEEVKNKLKAAFDTETVEVQDTSGRHNTYIYMHSYVFGEQLSVERLVVLARLGCDFPASGSGLPI